LEGRPGSLTIEVQRLHSRSDRCLYLSSEQRSGYVSKVIKLIGGLGPKQRAMRIESRLVPTSHMTPFEKVKLCGQEVWVRADPVSQQGDIDIAKGPLLDEYELEPIARVGYHVEWVLDIGAFIGTFTMKVKNLWPSANLIAFEPAPDSTQLYRLNTSRFQNISFYEAAAVRRGQEGIVTLSYDSFHAARKVKECVAQFGDTMTAGALVKALALLDVLEQHGNPEIAILKMDAEGVEADLLEDLKDAGYLNRIWWIRGEWHYDLSVSRIQSALEKTHVCNTARSVCGGWGPLIAHRKL